MTRFHKLILEGAARGLYEKPVEVESIDDIKNFHSSQSMFSLSEMGIEDLRGEYMINGYDISRRIFWFDYREARKAWQHIFGEQI